MKIDVAEAVELFQETVQSNSRFSEQVKEMLQDSKLIEETDDLDTLSEISTNETINVFSSSDEDEPPMEVSHTSLLGGISAEFPLVTEFQVYDEEEYVNSLFNLNHTKRKRKNSITDKYSRDSSKPEKNVSFSLDSCVHSATLSRLRPTRYN